MSRVLLIAADKPLPLCDKRVERSRTVRAAGEMYTVSCLSGFAVMEHAYYRSAVDHMALTMKPCQYELCAEVHEDDLAEFKAYLEQNFASGEEVELWNLWVGDDDPGGVPHYRGHLSVFDAETLEQFVCPPRHGGGIGQCCVTVVI